MALNEQQKAANKAALLVRDRAYDARMRDYMAAKLAAESDEAVVAAKIAANKLNDQQEALLTERNSKIDALRKQIAELESQVEALMAPQPEMESVNVLRSAAYNHWRRLQSDKVAMVAERFSDISGDAFYSVTLWQPPQDVLDAMEEASRNATPESVAPKKSKRA